MYLWILLSWVLPLLAQEPSPVSRVTTRLVQVTVVVQDRDGEPISDLSPDE